MQARRFPRAHSVLIKLLTSPIMRCPSLICANTQPANHSKIHFQALCRFLLESQKLQGLPGQLLVGLSRFRTAIYAKDPAFLLEESVTKGAEKDPKHVQTRAQNLKGIALAPVFSASALVLSFSASLIAVDWEKSRTAGLGYFLGMRMELFVVVHLFVHK
jgi:hypothetical protein